MATKNTPRTAVIGFVHSATAADPERLRARLELRRSSAASRHTSARRKGSRQDNRRRAIATAY